MSSAWRSGTPSRSNVSGAPATASPLMILAPPTFDHSARIVRTGTFCACSVTRPLLICSWSGSTCAAVTAATPTSAPASTRMRNDMGLLLYASDLIAAHMVDHAPDDGIELHLRLIADKFTDFRDVRHPARHVLEPGLICLVVRNVVNR